MKGKKLKYCVICLGIIVAGGLLVSLLYNSYNKKTHENQSYILIQYLENLLGIELADYVETVEGRVTIREGEEDDVIIKIKVLKEYEETVLDLLKDHFYEEDFQNDMFAKKGVYANSGVFADISDVFGEKLEVKDWKYIFTRLMRGKYAQTKLVRIHVAYNEKGMYVYFWS